MFGVALAAPGVGSQDQPQQTQDQSQKDQQQQKKKKKGGGFFGGLKAITGESSEQTEATATAGSKSVGEGDGARIADTTPTAADRRKVSEMENYSVPEKDLKKFQEDGHLVPKK
jgi:hypothetical protein